MARTTKIERRNDVCGWWNEAENRKEYYKKLLESVDNSNMTMADKHSIKTALHVLMKPHNASRTAEDWVRRMTMIEKGKRIKRNDMLICPFCGCLMELEETLMIDNRTIRYDPVPVKKHKRGCQLEFTGGAFIGQPESVGAAVKKWNRRTR